MTFKGTKALIQRNTQSSAQLQLCYQFPWVKWRYCQPSSWSAEWAVWDQAVHKLGFADSTAPKVIVPQNNCELLMKWWWTWHNFSILKELQESRGNNVFILQYRYTWFRQNRCGCFFFHCVMQTMFCSGLGLSCCTQKCCCVCGIQRQDTCSCAVVCWRCSCSEPLI